jgi:hypothetical protein
MIHRPTTGPVAAVLRRRIAVPAEAAALLLHTAGPAVVVLLDHLTAQAEAGQALREVHRQVAPLQEVQAHLHPVQAGGKITKHSNQKLGYYSLTFMNYEKANFISNHNCMYHNGASSVCC